MNIGRGPRFPQRRLHLIHAIARRNRILQAARLSLMRLLFTAIALHGTTVLLAQTPALGPEFQVNAYTTMFPSTGRVAMDPSGNFVVVWGGFTDGYASGVFGQRYDTVGVPQGGQFQVNVYTTGSQWDADVRMDSAGNFVVVFNSGLDIMARRFNSDGVPQGDEFLVNTYTTGAQSIPRIGMNGSGDFVVAWESFGQEGFAVFGQRYDNAGVPQGNEFRADGDTAAGSRPSVAMDATGNFVIVWSGYEQGSPTVGVFAQPFDNDGVPQGGAFRVNSEAPDLQGYPAVAMNASGRMIVTWWRYVETGGTDVFARRFDAGGAPQGDEFRVNAATVHDAQPSVSMNDSGDFVVAWTSARDDENYGIFGQRYDSEGRPVGSDFRVNTFTTGEQREPSVALDGAGNFVVAWRSYDLGGTFSWVSARRGEFQAALLINVDAHSAAQTSSNLNGVFEPGETVQIEPTWRDTLTLPLVLTGAASDLSGPPGSIFAIEDESAHYGAVPAGNVADCYGATPAHDCYVMTVSGVRPSSHWDMVFEESIAGFANPFMKTWTLHMGESFPDVPRSHIAYAYVENLFHNGVTAGCGNGNYCPDLPVTRSQVAALLLKAGHGSGYAPPPCKGVFADVDCPSPYADWIEQLFHEGTTGGCGGGNYCPDLEVTRAQMAVFLLKVEHDSSFVPPPCTDLFSDVPCPGPFADWIEQLYREGITGGCGDGQYCPSNPTTRAQMAVLFVRTFGFLLYGP